MSYHTFRMDNSDSRNNDNPPPQNESHRVPLATEPSSIPSHSILTPTQLTSPSPTSPPVKRKKENHTFIVYSTDQPAARKKRKRALSALEKLESILQHIQSLGNRFLGGRCQHHPGEIIHNWYSSPDGRLGENDDAASLMWSSCEPKYSQIKHIRACLTSFAAQICIEHAVRQAKNAVKPNNGLHVRLSAKGDSGSYSASLHTDWADIGSNTVSRVGDIFRTHEPFLYDFLSCVASGKIDGDLVRKTRPIDIVVTHSIAALNFSLNRFANWLPVAQGIFYFSTSAPVDVFAYASRTATMPAYSTLYSLLRELGMKEGLATKAAGSNPNLWGKVFFDNTQRYLRQRDLRFGREHKIDRGATPMAGLPRYAHP
ncbi:hypothetical protein FB446DRAFT_788168 [Lentinula raphanica]|nr:hypothetical protein FB446DRAFT_788168 [Lentinula raphanica]